MASFCEATKLAERCGFRDRKQVYYLVEQGMPAYRIGLRRLVFDVDEVEQWIRAQRVHTVRKASP